MTNKFKLGDKVKLLVDHKENTSSGQIVCLKGTIAFVCDDSHDDCIFVNAKDKNDEENMFCLYFNEVVLIK